MPQQDKEHVTVYSPRSADVSRWRPEARIWWRISVKHPDVLKRGLVISDAEAVRLSSGIVFAQDELKVLQSPGVEEGNTDQIIRRQPRVPPKNSPFQQKR